MRFAGKVAIVTGSGSGIGKATAESFAREGAITIICDLPSSVGAQVAESIRSGGGKAEFVPADVTDREAMFAMAAEVNTRHGHIDILHNNAGVPMSFTPIEEVSEAFYDKLMAVNVKGVVNGIQAVVPIMKAQKSGVIISTASTAAVRPRPGLNIYAASKGAVIALSKSLALELAQFQIRVNCINPVATDTPMLNQFIGNADIEAGRERFLSTVPLGRLAVPQDIADAVLFLASNEASLITGVDLEVDGGRCV